MIPKPSSCSDAYRAGLLDGEGQITVYRRPHGRGAAVVVGITNTNLALLKPFLVYGGKIGKPRVGGLGNKLAYDWKAHSIDAIQALKAMLPYLIRLKRKARIAITILQTTPSRGKHLNDKQVRIIDKARTAFYAS